MFFLIPCLDFDMLEPSWTPASSLEGYDPLLWMRADQGISTGGARDFEAASSAQATRASFAAVNLSTTDFSIVSNLHRETAGNMVIAAKYQDANNYWRFEITAGHKLHFIAVVATVTLIEVTGTTSLDSLATWYHAAVVVDRDAAGTTEIYLNGVNDTAGTPTVSATSIDNTGAFFLGESGAGSLYYDGRLSRVGVFKADLLTQTEITWLYNLGRSRIHGSLGEVGTDGASLAPTWWANCNETATAGDVVDQVAGANLTTAVGLPAVDGPSSDIAPDTGSVGTAHGQLIGFADSETARSTDVPSAIGSGTSLAFDGVDDNVRLSADIAVTSDFTYSLWFKYSALGTNILCGSLVDNNVSIYIDVVATTIHYRSSANVSRSFTVPSMSSATWYHLVVTRSSGTVRLYLNNVESSTGGIADAGDMPLGVIGSRLDSAAPWNGWIDDVRLYNGTALSSGQRTEVYGGSEAAGATPTAHWAFDEPTSLSVTDGDPIATWTSLEGSRHQFIQATASKRPVYRASAINGQAGIDFDGVDDLLAKASAFLTGTASTTIIIYRLDAVPNSYQVLLASSDEATATKYVALHGRGNTANPHLHYAQRNADTEDLLDGNTTVNVDTDCAGVWASNGTTSTARLNGTAQTLNADTGANNGDTWDDATGKDNVTLGAIKHTSETNFASGKICEVLCYPINLNAASLASISAYARARYGVSV